MKDFKILYVFVRLVFLALTNNEKSRLKSKRNEYVNLESGCISIWCQNSNVLQCESLKIFMHQRKSRSILMQNAIQLSTQLNSWKRLLQGQDSLHLTIIVWTYPFGKHRNAHLVWFYGINTQLVPKHYDITKPWVLFCIHR